MFKISGHFLETDNKVFISEGKTYQKHITKAMWDCHGIMVMCEDVHFLANETLMCLP